MNAKDCENLVKISSSANNYATYSIYIHHPQWHDSYKKISIWTYNYTQVDEKFWYILSITFAWPSEGWTDCCTLIIKIGTFNDHDTTVAMTTTVTITTVITMTTVTVTTFIMHHDK